MFKKILEGIGEQLCISKWQLENELEEITFPPGEYLFYRLIGEGIMSIDGKKLPPFNDRNIITDNNVQSIQILWNNTFVISLQPLSKYLDIIVICLDGENLPEEIQNTIHVGEYTEHQVGKGNYFRKVREIHNKPDGLSIFSGETLNPPGNWSSWPPHATEQDIRDFYEGETFWNEAFFVITPGYGLMHTDGIYDAGGTGLTTYKNAREKNMKAVFVRNGDCFYTPLGSHPIVADPQNWLWYAWFYWGNSLQKQYNKWATDVRTYVK